MEKYYTIGETAKIMNMTAKALRNYDHIDLLKPSYADPTTKYRYYTYEQFFTIDLIKYLNKILHIPLEDIKGLLHSYDNKNQLKEILVGHRGFIQDQIARYEYSLQLVDNMIGDIDGKKTNKKMEPLFEAYLMSRNYYYIELDVPISEIDKFVDRSAREFIQTENIENDTMCLMFSREQFEKEGKLMIKGFGVFSEQEIPGLKMKRFGEGRYLNHRFLFSEENSEKALREVLDYGEERNMKLADRCILISKTVDLTAKNRDFYEMEFQIFRKF